LRNAAACRPNLGEITANECEQGGNDAKKEHQPGGPSQPGIGSKELDRLQRNCYYQEDYRKMNEDGVEVPHKTSDFHTFTKRRGSLTTEPGGGIGGPGFRQSKLCGSHSR
jgi:hypothetical protein